MGNWSILAERQTVEKAIAALNANGINAEYMETAEDAKKRVLELIPEGAEVMTMTSTTIKTIGVEDELNGSGKFKPVRARLMDKSVPPSEKRKLGGGADFVTGSVHAVTEDGKIVVVSQSGSQLGAYSYGGGKVIWVVGTQKIVGDLNEAMARVNEYVLPLENERAIKAYGKSSSVNKILIISREANKERLHLIFVNERIGF